MSESIMKQADEIMKGMFTQQVADPVVSPTINESSTQKDLPDLSNEQRNSFINESVVDEDLGKELKPHAKTGETSDGTRKHARVSPSSRAQANLSPQGKSKLQRHKSREASNTDSRTSSHVERPQPSQTAKWSSQAARQSTHNTARGQKTRGSETKPAPKTMRQRQGKLTPAHQAKVAAAAPAHKAARHDRANKEREATKQKGLTRARQAYQSSQNAGTINMDKKRITIVEKGKKDDKWIQGAEADIKRRGTAGKCTPITKPGCTGKAKALAKTFKKMAKTDEGLTRENVKTLKKAFTILKEMTSVGSIGTTQGANMHGTANKVYDVDAKPMGKDTPKIAPVDKSLSKVSKSLKGKRTAKNKKVKKEAFERFLNAILSDAQKLKEEDVPTSHGDIPGSHGGHTRASVDKPSMTNKPETPAQKKARKDRAARGAAANATDRADAEAYNKRDPNQAIYKQIARTKQRNLDKKKASVSLGK